MSWHTVDQDGFTVVVMCLSKGYYKIEEGPSGFYLVYKEGSKDVVARCLSLRDAKAFVNSQIRNDSELVVS